jgi:hypothetical protein
MAITDITPHHMRCFAGSCPSVHELDDGRLMIIGKRGDFMADNLNIAVADSEEAIIIDRALLANVALQGVDRNPSNPEAPANPYEPIDPLYVKPQVEDVI